MWICRHPERRLDSCMIRRPSTFVERSSFASRAQRQKIEDRLRILPGPNSESVPRSRPGSNHDHAVGSDWTHENIPNARRTLYGGGECEFCDKAWRVLMH